MSKTLQFVTFMLNAESLRDVVRGACTLISAKTLAGSGYMNLLVTMPTIALALALTSGLQKISTHRYQSGLTDVS